MIKQEEGHEGRPDTARLIADIQSRPKQEISCRRILVPTDGSGQAFAAVNQAIHLAAVTGAALTLLMVVDLNKHVAAFEQVSLSGYVPSELKVSAYQFLADMMHVIPQEIRARTRVEVGTPGEMICEVAEQEHSDLIVMGSRGFGSFYSLLVGSVSHYVLQCAPCPVLIVKGLPDDWDSKDDYQNAP